MQLHVYFAHPLGEMQSVVQDGPTGGGTVLNQNLKEVNSSQQNNYASNDGSRPWDILEDQKPQGATDALGRPSSASTPPPTSRRSTRRERGTARTARTATRTAGSTPLATGKATSRITRMRRAFRSSQVGTGGNGGITDNNLPGLSGGTYKSRELGIDNLADVP